MDYKYYVLNRGYYTDETFETDSGMFARGLDVADMLSNVAKTEGDFFAGYQGVTWKETDKTRVSKVLGVADCDALFDKTYKGVK